VAGKKKAILAVAGTRHFDVKSARVTEPTSSPPSSPMRFGVWVILALVAVAGVYLYFRYQTSLTPMLGGGK
jgi:hypothetical protein